MGFFRTEHTFTVEKGKHHDWGWYPPGTYIERNWTTRGKVVAWAAALTLAAGAFAEKGLDVLGDKGTNVSPTEAKADAQTRYNTNFHRQNPAGKFRLQYLQVTGIGLSSRKDDGWGILDALNNEDTYAVEFNNACLANTAYDIYGGKVDGSVNGRGIKGKVEGNIPTASAYARVDSDEPNELVVSSGHSNSVDLTFEGLQSNQLSPSDQQTEDMLRTYGCEVGMQSESVYDTGIIHDKGPEDFNFVK